jgi:hypothetical protein
LRASNYACIHKYWNCNDLRCFDFGLRNQRLHVRVVSGALPQDLSNQAVTDAQNSLPLNSQPHFDSTFDQEIEKIATAWPRLSVENREKLLEAIPKPLNLALSILKTRFWIGFGIGSKLIEEAIILPKFHTSV